MLDPIPIADNEKPFLTAQGSQLFYQCGCLGDVAWDGHIVDVVRINTRMDVVDATIQNVLNQVEVNDDTPENFKVESDGKTFLFAQTHYPLFKRDEVYAKKGEEPPRRFFNVYCYESEPLNKFLKQAENGIRFVDDGYQEKFRLKDGDSIRFTSPDGYEQDEVCRYIDGDHLQIGEGGSARCYHILEFAEMQQRNGNTIIPLRSSLPDACFTISEMTGELIELHKGENGYYPTTGLVQGEKTPEQLRSICDGYNGQLGVTREQEEEMSIGSMFGWDKPGADPDFHAPVIPKLIKLKEEQENIENANPQRIIGENEVSIDD